MAKMTDAERAALERLISHAMRDSGQSRRVADFLLAWWNPGQCGGFDINVTWGLDDEIVEDVVVVFGYAARNNHYPDTLGYGSQFEAIVRAWRPELVSEEGQ